MTKAVTEQELQEKAVAPRVTKDQIDALVDRVVVHTTTCMTPVPHVLAIAWLDDKFYLGTAISKSVNPKNFDEEIGIQYSTKDVLEIAENKLWELEGYRLFANPAQPPKNHIERMQFEKLELDTKLNALKAFLAKLGTDQAPLLTDDQVGYLEEQCEAMQSYSDVLGVRIEYDTEYLKAIGA